MVQKKLPLDGFQFKTFLKRVFLPNTSRHAVLEHLPTTDPSSITQVLADTFYYSWFYKN